MDDALTFATGPVMLDEDGDELRKELADHLATTLERPVTALATRSYTELAALFGSRDDLVAWLPPALYVRTEPSVGLRLLAEVERSHGEGYRGVLFVSQDSDVKELADLAGKRVAWVDRDSCAGHLFPRLELRERGFDPGELFREERFVGSHGSSVRAVMNGEADVGATHAQTREGSDELMLAGWGPYAGADGMRPVLVTRPIPPDVLCASGKLDPSLAEAVQRALLGLHDAGLDDLLDELFGAERLVTASAGDYDAVRAAMR